jgi:nucleoside-diphosphate-sugar epimerase
MLETAARERGTKVKVRVANRPILALLSLVNSEIRGIKDLYTLYMSPPILDGSKLRRLLGDFPATLYHAGVSRTLEWLRAR